VTSHRDNHLWTVADVHNCELYEIVPELPSDQYEMIDDVAEWLVDDIHDADTIPEIQLLDDHPTWPNLETV
jgi:hypothetical protein